MNKYKIKKKKGKESYDPHEGRIFGPKAQMSSPK